MKPWIVWMCFGLLYLGVQEAEARRITGGKPMAPRSPSINYEQLQQHRTQSRAGYQSGYYDQAYRAEVRRGRSVNSMVESNTGSPPIIRLITVHSDALCWKMMILNDGTSIHLE